ncbi:TraR/DksA family transcriptional regulator [Zobellella sp. An-6]|uniref:TraR/DksA family transcriptional regulator n=1 Tax=Zobellella sp. An-6 TaxID=3400218 RepID=UPI0040421781
MDLIDRANALHDWLLAKELAAQTGQRPAGDSRADCLECGDVIPEARRAALPGVTLCVHCQTLMEKRR